MEIKEVFDKVISYSSTDISRLKEISDNAFRNNMIPKIVHFCFLDYRNMTERHLKYLKTWFEVLDDSWTFVNWTPELSEPVCEFERYTLDNNKFAFYADYIRCARVYEYGGVYFDCDVRVIQPIDELLDMDYVIDMEYERSFLEPASFMMKKNNMFLGIIKESYEKEKYDAYSLSPRDFLCPEYWMNVLAKNGITTITKSAFNMEDYRSLVGQKKKNLLYTLDGTFLSCPCRTSIWTVKKQEPSEHTYTSHNFEGTWSY